eukprot:TRINITY_DN6567_c0_g1_i1.p1 TRINITY_DN6567_c0_g1~~TRINITY_DN6567_c0_g1_i1.p1  ORF type:complete len:391 (-),score=69.85 TRINITY_DN6567_c0_g1_i1:150-1322(-)
MRFYKTVDNVNTVLYKHETDPRLVINIVDLTELQRQTGDTTIVNDVQSRDSNEEEHKPQKSISKKLKKKDLEESNDISMTDSESISMSISSSADTEDGSISENKYNIEEASETEHVISNKKPVDVDKVTKGKREKKDSVSSGSSAKNPDWFNPKSIVTDDRNFDVMYKVIVCGNAGVGKSSVLGRWMNDDFALSISPTLHVELNAKTFDVNDVIVKVQFWDTVGQERFHSITKQYYRGSHGAVLVYDVTNRESFNAVSHWSSEVREVNPDAVILLVGNKTDMETVRQVPTQEALNYSKKEGISFLETSAYSGANCTKAMQLILQEIHQVHGVKKGKSKLNSKEEKGISTKTMVIEDNNRSSSTNETKSEGLRVVSDDDTPLDKGGRSCAC